MKLFEVLMLVCFGISWPINIIKSIRSRTSKGKSLLFLIVVVLGYVCGMINKILSGFDWVFFMYMTNGLMVITDIALYYRNKALDRERMQIGK